MSDPKTQQEPSMEEILASIRRIISEDGEGDAPAKSEAAKGGNGAASEASEDDVIELTEIVEEAPAVAAAVVETAAAEPVAAAPEPAAPAESVEAAAEPAEAQPAEAEAQPVEAETQPAEAGPAADAAEEEEAPAVDPSDAALFGASEAEPAPAEARVRDDRVISEQAAGATMRALGSLSSTLQGSGAGLPLGEGSRTIEDIVRDLLRPMLREWLDANLPEVVQRIVQKEVRELVRRAEDI